MKRLFICVVGLVIAVTAWSRTFNMKELGADPRGCTRKKEVFASLFCWFTAD